MANIMPFPDDLPLSLQIKSLADEELLDFWEETQFMERFLDDTLQLDRTAHADYERLIVQELQLRSCRKCAERQG